MMKLMFLVQTECDYSFHDLSLRRAYLSIYYTSCFLQRYHNKAALVIMIDTLNIARVATARLMI